MRQQREKVTENGANNQTGGGSLKAPSTKKSKTDLILYIIAGLIAVGITYLISK